MTNFVLFFQHLPPYPGAGSLRAQSVIEALALRHHPGIDGIYVLTSTPHAQPISGCQIINLAVHEVENSQGLLRRIWGEIRLGVAASKAVPSLITQSDILVISSPAYLSALILSTYARYRRIRYIIELRDIYPQVYAESGLIGSRSIFYRIFASLSRRMYVNAELIVAATNGLARVVLEDAPTADVRCVYNGYPARIANVSAPKHKKFTVCFHGVMGYFQDIQSLIDLASTLSTEDIDVIVIGYGNQAELARACDLPNFVFKGRLSFEDTILEISKCHVGLCLRKSGNISEDSFPVKVWEYLGLGLPTLVTPHCEAGTFLEENACGIQFEAGAVKDIAMKVIELKKKSELLFYMSSNCKKVGTQYTREKLGIDIAHLILDKL
ncbi:glycosyltransferase family 4 protein [Sphingorhabdus contaminans]|uniref:Glycosyltransferase family 4 protein n=1 Tax=Sphingorhabdus contaminans TaxID=1343899 RepID=A0A553WBG7_9SPHN|nr:glycosyltransferase family 4 protein [Sphingorhabdus contaminans]